MKWTKSIIGEIGFVDTENKLTYKDAIKKIPKNARIMKAWEFLKLIDEDFKSLKNIPEQEFYFCYGTETYFRACGLGRFYDGSRFFAGDGGVDNPYGALRGVMMVKR